ncbi:unnamed protein product, partial [Ectocarpus sp. 12 AP-2014]
FYCGVLFFTRKLHLPSQHFWADGHVRLRLPRGGRHRRREQRPLGLRRYRVFAQGDARRETPRSAARPLARPRPPLARDHSVEVHGVGVGGGSVGQQQQRRRYRV